MKKRAKYARISKAKDLNRRMDIWYGVPKEDITHCKKCGKKIWTKWLVRKPWEKNKEMNLCGPCYFGTRR